MHTRYLINSIDLSIKEIYVDEVVSACDFIDREQEFLGKVVYVLAYNESETHLLRTRKEALIYVKQVAEARLLDVLRNHEKYTLIIENARDELGSM